MTPPAVKLVIEEPTPGRTHFPDRWLVRVYDHGTLIGAHGFGNARDALLYVWRKSEPWSMTVTLPVVGTTAWESQEPLTVDTAAEILTRLQEAGAGPRSTPAPNAEPPTPPPTNPEPGS